MKEDIKILEDMRDKIYGEIQFVDDFDIEIECQKQFDALNLAINHLRKTRLIKNNFIPKSKAKEKIEELKKELTNEITKNDGFAEYREYAIDILEELMEDK